MLKKYLGIISLAAVFAIPSLVAAQSTGTFQAPQIQVDHIVLSQPSVSQGDTVTGTFELINQGTTDASNIGYRISLVGNYQPNTLAGTFYDTSVQQGSVFVPGNASVSVPFTYTLPIAISGTGLGIQIQAFTSAGIPLGWSDDKLTVHAKQGIVLPPTLAISSAALELGTTTFPLQAGPVVHPGETPTLVIGLTAPTATIPVIAHIDLYNRVITGTPLIASTSAMTLTTHTKTFSIALPLPTTAGVYDTRVTVETTDGVSLAPPLDVRYIVAGDIITIQSLTSNVTSVSAGNPFTLTLQYTGSPFDIRTGAIANQATSTLTVTVANELGVTIATSQGPLDPAGGTLAIPLTASTNATAMTATATVTNNGKVIATYSTNLSPNVAAARAKALATSPTSPWFFIILAIVLLLLVLLISLLLKKKKLPVTPLVVLAVMAVCGLTLFSGAGVVKGDYSGDPGSVTITGVNLTDTNGNLITSTNPITPGSNFLVRTNVTAVSCSNAPQNAYFDFFNPTPSFPAGTPPLINSELYGLTNLQSGFGWYVAPAPTVTNPVLDWFLSKKYTQQCVPLYEDGYNICKQYLTPPPSDGTYVMNGGYSPITCSSGICPNAIPDTYCNINNSSSCIVCNNNSNQYGQCSTINALPSLPPYSYLSSLYTDQNSWIQNYDSNLYLYLYSYLYYPNSSSNQSSLSTTLYNDANSIFQQATYDGSQPISIKNTTDYLHFTYPSLNLSNVNITSYLKNTPATGGNSTIPNYYQYSYPLTAPTTPGTYHVYLLVEVQTYYGVFVFNSAETNITYTVANPTTPTSPTVTLSASPTAVSKGGSTTLTPTITGDPTSCTASNSSNNSGWSGSVSSAGVSQTVSSINTTTTFTLTCTNSAGTGTGNTTVTVPTASLSVSPSTVNIGDPYTISWGSTGATTCSSNDFTTNGATGNTISITPTTAGKKTYMVTCSNTSAGASASASASAQATVIVNNPLPPSISNFNFYFTSTNTCSPELTWSVSNLDGGTCTMSSSNNDTNWSGTSSSFPSSGTASINPSVGATYTLQCSNAAGNSSPVTTSPYSEPSGCTNTTGSGSGGSTNFFPF